MSKQRAKISEKLPRTLLVKNLSVYTDEEDMRQIFNKFGEIVKIVLEKGTSTSHAYVEFKTSMEAEYAFWQTNDYDHKIEVQLVEELSGKPIPPKFRVVVRGLPFSVSSKELKAHMKRAGPITFAQTFLDDKDAGKKYGLVDYVNLESMKTAIRELNGSKLIHLKDTVHIRVKKYEGSSLIKQSPSPPKSKKRHRPVSTSPTRSSSMSKNARQRANHH